jgi:hypothetical protein
VIVIIAVNVFSQYSSIAAAIATAPTGTPLSIWVMVQQRPGKERQATPSRTAQSDRTYTLRTHPKFRHCVTYATDRAQVLLEYTSAVMKGVAATFAFALGSHVAARDSWGMWPVIGAGYAAWFVAWLLLERML